MLTRNEDFSFSPKRFATELLVKSALDDKGKLAGIDITAHVNLGSYAVYENDILDQMYLGCTQAYKTRNIRFSGKAFRTNIPPQGPFAGFGLAEGAFALERQVSVIAERCGQYPGQWRKDNIVNAVNETNAIDALIDGVMNSSDYRRKWASYDLLKQLRIQHTAQDSAKNKWIEKGEKLRGIALALGSQGSGLPVTVKKKLRPAKTPTGEEWTSGRFSRPGWASAVVEVEIDPVEFVTRIRGVWLNVNGGKILSENDARRSLKAAAVQALGWAYREHISYINGVIPAEQFYNFDIPGTLEIPPVYIDFFPGDSETPKGIGDLPFACVPAAYIQAVSQAMDHHFTSIPLKPMDMWYALVRKRGGV
jgi:CO/xanthine dehydrogenase Mo-binding subunit